MNKKMIGIGIGIILLLMGAGGFMVMRGGQGPTPTPTPFESPTEEPTPTPEEVDISKLKLKVLNGTATGGLAVKMKTALESAGFTVSATGNADTKDYQAVEIQAKESVSAQALSKLKDEIGKTYTIGTEKTLDSADENDIVIIIGAKSQPTPTVDQKKAAPTATPGTATPTTGPTQTIAPTPTKTP